MPHSTITIDPKGFLAKAKAKDFPSLAAHDKFIDLKPVGRCNYSPIAAMFAAHVVAGRVPQVEA